MKTDANIDSRRIPKMTARLIGVGTSICGILMDNPIREPRSLMYSFMASNIFAILGLRALYFALAAISRYFTYLKYGLGIILSFVGIKMLLEVTCDIKVPTTLSLVFIFSVLVLSMGLSYIISNHHSHGD